MAASINAEAFYARHGFAVVERGTHRLHSGVEMACVRMRKALAGAPGTLTPRTEAPPGASTRRRDSA
jgi:hypothetical protein